MNHYVMPCCKGDIPMCCSMKVLSVRGTLFRPILVCPLFRMSSRTDFKLGNLRIRRIWVSTNNMHRKKTLNPRNLLLISTKLTHYSPPCQVGLCYLHHSYRSLVDFDECTTEDFPKPKHLDDFHHFGTDTFNPKRRDTKKKWHLIVQFFFF